MEKTGFKLVDWGLECVISALDVDAWEYRDGAGSYLQISDNIKLNIIHYLTLTNDMNLNGE